MRFSPFAATIAAISLLAPAASHANGRFPIADQLVVDPKDPAHIVLRTTYGILETSNTGSSWSWICEGAVGYGGTQDPAIGVLADGTILAGVFEGLSVSHDRGCAWGFVEAPLKDEYVIDVSVHRDDPTRAVAITSTGKGTDGFHVIIAETADSGGTWTQAGKPLLSDFIALTVDVTPSNPQRLYASGIVGKSFAPAIERSDDRGETWTRTYLDAAYAKFVPFLAAIDPQNPDRVYLRLSGDPVDKLLVSDDAGATFTEAFTGTDDLLGFALSPDGTRVAIGGPKDGVQIANTADLAFQKVSSIYTRCLTWTTAGMYACGNQFVDHFTVGFSKDEGKTFENIYNLPDICPLECGEGATTPTACLMTWPGIAATLGIDPSACGGIGAGSGSGSGSGGSGPRELEPAGGCDCGLGSASGASGAAALGGLAALVLRLRRRKDRRAPAAKTR
ncbi:WD40/YVTN/BNR-like repeat-containing protein [Polyangium sorediatum]|uniref:MYXO-CTERM sorting domain-containing protein n=1 Tax=Polyangium sorediatum TaxID=889274 RepID=A0ABT6P8Y6_9BACT|nr:MYXO-CTERM sorting domain-containing protein [Polyangium sorediatum]MDI1437080.1 MYXO-CTERM sorting domain-containing protein [Polyangium sorediatum]